MANVSKSRGFKVPKYIENVGQSVRLSGIKLIKDKYLPNTSSLIGNITQYGREIASDSSGSDRSFKAILDKNSSIKNITDALKFAKEDLKSGKFVNPERADELSKEFMGDFGDFGFDFENDIGDANISFNEENLEGGASVEFNYSTDVSMDTKVSTVMTSRALAKSSAIISETVHKSNRTNMGAFIEYDKQKTASSNSFFATMFAETNNSIGTVNNNIATIISFHNDITKEYYDKSLSAIQSIVDPIKNLEGYMKEITEMKRNMYDDYIRTNGPGSNRNNKYNDVLGYGLDPEKFLNNAIDNMKGSSAGGVLSMFEGDMGRMLIDSPLQAIPGLMIGSLLSKTLTGSLADLDKTVGNFFKAGNNKLGAMKNDNSILGKIASILHVQNDMKTSVSAGGYVKGPIPFDGITKKAIVDVIAPTLLRIESHLTGSAVKNMNYETGQYESIKETKKRFEQELDKPIVHSMSDTRNRMSWIMRDSELDDNVRKGAEESFDEILKHLVKNPNKFYNPHKEKEAYDIFKGNKKISKDSVKLFNKVFMSMSAEDRIAFQSEIADARSDNSNRLENLDKEMSEKGYSILFDKSMNTANRTVTDKVSKVDYTKQIRDILVRGIKVFGSTTEGSSQAPSYYDITGKTTDNSGMKIKRSVVEEGHLKFKSNLDGSKHARRNAMISGASIDSSKYYDIWKEGEQGALSNNKVMNAIDKYARKTKNMAVGGAYKALYGENPYESEEDNKSKLPKIRGLKGVSGNDKTIKGGIGGNTSLNWKSSKSLKDSKDGKDETKDDKASKTLGSINNAMDKYSKLFSDNKDKIKKFSKGAGLSLGAGLMFNSPMMAMGGLTVSFINSSDRAKNILFGELGEDGQRKEGGLVSPKIQKFMKNAMGNMGIGALASTIMSSTFLGGFGMTAPIVGAGLGMLASSETVKNHLFGGLDKDGNREGGMISKEMQDTMKKFALPTLGGLLGGGIAGQLLHQFAGFGAMTPLLTGSLGAGIGILSKSDKFNNWMFGEVGEDGKRKGGFDKKMQEFFKKNMGAIGGATAGMALGGLSIGGPTGMVLGSLGGLSLGIMSQSEGVKSYLFGDVDPETMKRKGGLLGQVSSNMKSWFTESIANPFKEAITPIKSAFKDMTQSIKGVFIEGWKGITSSVNDVFKESVGQPLKDLVKEKITDPLKNMITKLIFGAGKILGGIISAPMKGITAFAQSLTGNKDKDLEKDMKAYDKMDSTSEKATKGIKGFTGKFKDFMGTMKVAGMSIFAVKKASEVEDELKDENKKDKKKMGFFGKIKARIKKGKDSVVEKGGDAINTMNVSGKTEEVISKTNEVLNSAKDIVSDLTGKAKDKAKNAKDIVVDSISGSDSKVGSIIDKSKNAVMGSVNSIKNSDMGNMDSFKSALKRVKEMKPSMAKRMKLETAAQYKARIIAMAEKLTGGTLSGKDKTTDSSNSKTTTSSDSESEGDVNKITITGVKNKSFFSRLFGGKDMSDEEKYKRKSKSSLLGRLFGGHGRAVASTDPTPLPLTAGTQANINNFLPNIADTLNKIYKEMNGQLDGTGYNLETIKNILQTQFGSPDVEAKGMKTSRGNKTRRTKFGRMMDMIMSPVSVLIGKPLAFLSKFSPMKMLGKAFSLPKMLLEGVFGLPGKIAGGGKALFSLIMKPIELAGKSIAGGVKFLIDISSKVMNGLTDLVGKSLGHLTNIMTKGLDSMVNVVGTLGETVGNIMKTLPDIIASLGGVAIEGAKAVGRGLKTGIELTGKGIGNMIGMMKGINIPNPSLIKKVEVVGGQLDNVKNIDTVSLIKALAGMGPEYVDNAETRFMKETDGYKNIKKESEKDKDGTDKMQSDIGKMAKGAGEGFMDKVIKWLPTIATGIGGLVTFLSGAGFVNAIKNAFFNKDKTTEERVESGLDAVRYGNRAAYFGLKTANKMGIKGAEKLAKFKATKIGGMTANALEKGKGVIAKAGKNLIDDGAKLAIKGKNILMDILTNSKILKLIGGDKIIKKLTPVLKQITSKFGEKMAKGAAKKAAKAGAKSSVRTGSRALAATGVGAIVTAVVEAGFMTADFMSGYTSPNRYFKLPKDVEPDKNMRIAAGIGNLISGLLMEVDSFFEKDDSPKLFVSLIYNQLASEEEQQKTKEQQKRMQEEFKAYKQSTGNEKLTFEEYNKQQNATIWEKAGQKIANVYNKGKNVVNKASEMYNNAKKSVVDKYNGAKDYISDKYNSIVDTIKKLSDPRFLGKVVGMGVAHLQKAWDKSVEYIKSIPDRVSKAISDLGGKITEGYNNIKEGVKNFASSMVDKISNKATEIKDGILSIPNKIIDWWNSPGSIFDWIKELPTKIWEKAIEWKDKIFNFGKDVKDAVVNKVENVKTGVKNVFKKITNAKDEFVQGYDEGKTEVLGKKEDTVSKAAEIIQETSTPQKKDEVIKEDSRPVLVENNENKQQSPISKAAEIIQETSNGVDVKDATLEMEEQHKKEMEKLLEESNNMKKSHAEKISKSNTYNDSMSKISDEKIKAANMALENGAIDKEHHSKLINDATIKNTSSENYDGFKIKKGKDENYDGFKIKKGKDENYDGFKI
ncbi:MAG: hypothetical protein ACRCXT_22130, partial [Paraclostridium sp.]